MSWQNADCNCNDCGNELRLSDVVLCRKCQLDNQRKAARGCKFQRTKTVLEPFIVDERVGCVAVYRGPKINCLNGISLSPNCKYYANGKKGVDGWEVDPVKIRAAQIICAVHNAVDQLILEPIREAKQDDNDQPK